MTVFPSGRRGGGGGGGGISDWGKEIQSFSLRHTLYNRVKRIILYEKESTVHETTKLCEYKNAEVCILCMSVVY